MGRPRLQAPRIALVATRQAAHRSRSESATVIPFATNSDAGTGGIVADPHWRLMKLVLPLGDHGCGWWAWQKAAGAEQPIVVHVWSRTFMSLRMEPLTSRCSRPASRT